MSQQTKLSIGFDIDGVISRFTEDFSERLNQHFFTNGMTDYIETPVTDYWFLDKYMDLFEAEIRNDLFLDVSPYEESVVYVNSLITSNLFDVHFITARGSEKGINWDAALREKAANDTRTWLRHYFPTFHMDNLHFCGRKDEIIRNRNLALFVEDRADSGARFAKVCQSFVITRPWNAAEHIGDAVRIHSLCDLELFLDKHIDKTLRTDTLKEVRVNGLA